MPERVPKASARDVPDVILALRAPQAAKALGISQRLLATLTGEGRVPFVRINRAVVYPVADLRHWLSEQARICRDAVGKSQSGGIA